MRWRRLWPLFMPPSPDAHLHLVQTGGGIFKEQRAVLLQGKTQVAAAVLDGVAENIAENPGTGIGNCPRAGGTDGRRGFGQLSQRETVSFLAVLGERISTTRSGAPKTPLCLILLRSQTTIISGINTSFSVRLR